MSDKKEALPGATDRASANHSFDIERDNPQACNTSIPHDSDLSNPQSQAIVEREPYCRIMSALGHGRQNAIHRNDLMRITGLPDRMLRRHIKELNRSGTVILSGDFGYCLLDDDLSELRKYIRKEEHRARSIFYTLKAARQLEAELGVGDD